MARLCSFCLFVEELISLVGLADDASIVDLTSHQVTVNTLTEARINCTTEQKVVIFYGNPHPMSALLLYHCRMYIYTTSYPLILAVLLYS